MKAILIILVTFSLSFAQISRDAIVRTTDIDGGSDHTTGTIAGGTDKTFVLALTLQGDDDVTGSPSGGSLTWVEQVDACADAGQTGLHIWTAQGTASSFTVTVTFASVTSAVVSHVVTYSGVETTSGFEDQHWENETAEGTDNPGACEAIDASSPATFTIGNSAADSWFFIMVSPRQETITSGASGLSNEIYDVAGSGGNIRGQYTYDLDRVSATGDVAYSFTLSSASDWVVGGIVMKEAAGGEPNVRFKGIIF